MKKMPLSALVCVAALGLLGGCAGAQVRPVAKSAPTGHVASAPVDCEGRGQAEELALQMPSCEAYAWHAYDVAQYAGRDAEQAYYDAQDECE